MGADESKPMTKQEVADIEKEVSSMGNHPPNSGFAYYEFPLPCLRSPVHENGDNEGAPPDVVGH